MAMVTASLREAGYEVDQDDLNVKVHTDNFFRRNAVEEGLFFDTHRAYEFTQGKRDRRLERAVDRILHKTWWDGYDAYLFSCYLSQNATNFAMFLCIGHVLRRKFPSQPFVMGGNCASFLTDDIFAASVRSKVLDFAIEGPGEHSIVQLLNSLEQKGEVSHVPGLIYMRGDTVARNPRVAPRLPIRADFEGLPMDLYTYPCSSRHSSGSIRDDKDVLILPYKFTNGCPHRCAFCFVPPIDTFAYKSVDEVLDPK